MMLSKNAPPEDGFDMSENTELYLKLVFTHRSNEEQKILNETAIRLTTDEHRYIDFVIAKRLCLRRGHAEEDNKWSDCLYCGSKKIYKVGNDFRDLE